MILLPWPNNMSKRLKNRKDLPKPAKVAQKRRAKQRRANYGDSASRMIMCIG